MPMKIGDGYATAMGVTLSGLRAFMAVARTGSFSAGAELLGMRQPTISDAIRRLETETGQPLLHRAKDRVTLTILGQRILHHAAAAVDAADGLEALIHRTSPELAIGFMGEAAARRTGDLLAIIQAYLEVPVTLHRYDYDDPSCGLSTGHTDLAIVWPPLTAPGVRLFTVGSDRRAVALPATDPLAHLDKIAPSQLAGRVWITPRSADIDWANYRHPQVVGVKDVADTLPAGSIEETLEMVAAKRGTALVSESTDQHYARFNVVIVPLAGDIRCTTAVAWREADRRPVITRTVTEVSNAFTT